MGWRDAWPRKRIQIDRILNPKSRKEQNLNRVLVDLNLSELIDSKNDYELSDDDLITFFRINDIIGNMVELRGAVLRPGKYSIGNQLDIKSLINNADGLLNTAYMDRLDIIRRNSIGQIISKQYRHQS